MKDKCRENPRWSFVSFGPGGPTYVHVYKYPLMNVHLWIGLLAFRFNYSSPANLSQGQVKTGE